MLVLRRLGATADIAVVDAAHYARCNESASFWELVRRAQQAGEVGAPARLLAAVPSAGACRHAHQGPQASYRDPRRRRRRHHPPRCCWATTCCPPRWTTRWRWCSTRRARARAAGRASGARPPAWLPRPGGQARPPCGAAVVPVPLERACCPAAHPARPRPLPLAPSRYGAGRRLKLIILRNAAQPAPAPRPSTDEEIMQGAQHAAWIRMQEGGVASSGSVSAAGSSVDGMPLHEG